MIDNFIPEDWEVVWSGGPLLPPRSQRTSPLWDPSPENGRNKSAYTHTFQEDNTNIPDSEDVIDISDFKVE